MELTGKVIVVIGGSSGIGAAAVRHFAALGASVVVGYHNGEERAQALIDSLPKADHAIARVQLEAPKTFAILAEQLRERFGKVDVLVNSAGFTRAIPHADLDKLDDILFEQILMANVRGPYSAIRALAPLLRASGDAVVINVSSVSGFTASGSNVAYCASKAALDNITMSLGRALGPEIRVLSVSPGAVATDFVPGRDRAALETSAKSAPLRRVIEPDDVAAAITACVTHLKASTGIKIVVDGGRHL
ncbi:MULTISPECIES: SDR family oxidoreductase [unclassified Beijerinckia]|uniref:SDR family NAD(P)-dependent oxidoreductase n=1 Tax=unclassified Beijerinckia TaxID=2638183 RepID=UPI00089433E9|nr:MULTISPECIES: SDR family oxidoreductase [unclassified Beijerinckia]MDH7794059.1 3-oxoacyl-[acyl-carrier protein] reductase [Beijerinckia sp. GAS462]SEB52388.1 3-oxoacyl-[acyl-carrier protein] reductase [Beijerinckia sp. 28-YEA-48]